MAYSAGMLNKKITFARRLEGEEGSYGRNSAGIKYEIVGTFNAAEDFKRGVKDLREGAVDAYNTVMFRMRYRSCLDRWCLIKYQGRWYEIESFNAEYQSNQLQITAHERVNQNVTIVEPKPEPTPTPDPEPETEENENK